MRTDQALFRSIPWNNMSKINPLVYTLLCRSPIFWNIRQNCEGGTIMLWCLQVFPPDLRNYPPLNFKSSKLLLSELVLAKASMANSQWTLHSSNGLHLPYGENMFLWLYPKIMYLFNNVYWGSLEQNLWGKWDLYESAQENSPKGGKVGHRTLSLAWHY